MSFTQIDSDCKLAREYALLGNYDTAMVYYQGVLQEVFKLFLLLLVVLVVFGFNLVEALLS